MARRAGPNLRIETVRFRRRFRKCAIVEEAGSHLIRTKGIGMQRRAKRPSTVDAH